MRARRSIFLPIPCPILITNDSFSDSLSDSDEGFFLQTSGGSLSCLKLLERFTETINVRGKPWTMEACELRNVMGAVIKQERDSALRLFECYIGGKSRVN